MIEADLARVGLSGALDAASPDGDIGKFSLFGQSVRVITHRDGYYLNINLAWFNGADVPAQISGGPIEIYCFVLKGPVPRYWLCDWRTMRRFVFDFSASSLPHYKRTVRWRSDVQAIQHAADAALFRWGDENGMEQLQKPSRIVDLGNATSVQPVRPEDAARHDRDGTGSDLGGECQSHKILKYATLAAMERDFPVVTHSVRAHVVAYKLDYPSVIEVAGRYGVNLVAVDPELCLVA